MEIIIVRNEKIDLEKAPFKPFRDFHDAYGELKEAANAELGTNVVEVATTYKIF